MHLKVGKFQISGEEELKSFTPFPSPCLCRNGFVQAGQGEGCPTDGVSYSFLKLSTGLPLAAFIDW
jgi:hypothetical protein